MRLPTRLLRRNLKAHKGDFGHIFIIAGSGYFSGAAFLCAAAALRSGAGLVTLGIPRSLLSGAIKKKLWEAMLLPLPETKEATLSLKAYTRIKKFISQSDVLVIGPGITKHRQTQKLIRKIIAATDKPMVIDADGLSALAGSPNILRKTVLTPHPGEMARLLGVDIKEVQADREGIARKCARGYKATVVLKGYRTVVSDSKKYYINHTGNPGMSTAGSGDVLSGMIAAFLAQGLDSFSAAKYAVYLHGLAGDLAAKQKSQISLIASDIIDKIPEAVKRSS